VGVPELVVAGAVVVAAILLWRHASPARWVRVDEARHVAVLAAALEGPFARLLSDLPATDLHAGGRSTWTLSVARPQSWSYVPAVLLFPMGLLFLLFRDTATLVVVVRPAADGAIVRPWTSLQHREPRSLDFTGAHPTHPALRRPRAAAAGRRGRRLRP
jgi:hypothetical protein